MTIVTALTLTIYSTSIIIITAVTLITIDIPSIPTTAITTIVHIIIAGLCCNYA